MTKKILLFAILVLVTTSLLLYNSFSGEIRVNEISNLKIADVSDSTLTLHFSASIENQTGKNLEISLDQGKFYKNEEYLGDYSVSDKIVLSGKKEDNIPVEVVVKTSKGISILEDGISLLLGNSVKLKTTGTIKAKWLVFTRDFPYEAEEELNLQNILEKIQLPLK